MDLDEGNNNINVDNNVKIEEELFYLNKNKKSRVISISKKFGFQTKRISNINNNNNNLNNKNEENNMDDYNNDN